MKQVLSDACACRYRVAMVWVTARRWLIVSPMLGAYQQSELLAVGRALRAHLPGVNDVPTRMRETLELYCDLLRWARPRLVPRPRSAPAADSDPAAADAVGPPTAAGPVDDRRCDLGRLVRFGCPLARVPAGPLSLNEWQPMARSPPLPRPE